MTGPRILRADDGGIADAAECIRSGGVVVYPTETVYGVGVDPFSTAAVQRVFAMKGRDASKGMILLLRDEGDLDLLVESVTPDARHLMQAFWPGPLTLVLAARPELPPALLGGASTVAVRVSDNVVCRELAGRAGGAITSTSANRSGCPPALSAAEAIVGLGPDVDVVLDGGESADPRPSTVVDMTTNPPTVLREGRISTSGIERLLQRDNPRSRGPGV
jgi:L-threonylcarbamoyladenylate synthase